MHFPRARRFNFGGSPSASVPIVCFESLRLLGVRCPVFSEFLNCNRPLPMDFPRGNGQISFASVCSPQTNIRSSIRRCSLTVRIAPGTDECQTASSRPVIPCLPLQRSQFSIVLSVSSASSVVNFPPACLTSSKNSGAFCRRLVEIFLKSDSYWRSISGFSAGHDGGEGSVHRSGGDCRRVLLLFVPQPSICGWEQTDGAGNGPGVFERERIAADRFFPAIASFGQLVYVFLRRFQ